MHSALGDSVGDPSATRTVYLTVVLLALLGVVFVALAVWVYRRTRPDLELLAPLEEMERRKWRSLDPAAQRRLLDEARPAGAMPLERSSSVPNVDQEFSSARPVQSFEDLAADRVAAERTTEAVDADLELPTHFAAALDDLDETGSIAADDGDPASVVETDDEPSVVETVDEPSDGEATVDEAIEDEVIEDEAPDDGVVEGEAAVDEVIGDEAIGDEVTDPDEVAERVESVADDEPGGGDDSGDEADDGVEHDDDPAAEAPEPDAGGAAPDVEDAAIEHDDASDRVPVVPGEGLLRRPRVSGD